MSLEVAASDLNLKLSPETEQKFIESSGATFNHLDRLACKSSLEARYSIGNYLSGRHTIRAFTTHKREENTKLKTNHFMEVVLPNPWNINQFDFDYKNINICCLEISPDFHSENIKILSLGTDAHNQISDFNFVTTFKSTHFELKCIFRNTINRAPL